MKSEWIKLNDWKKVKFPNTCPYSELEANETKEYYVYNASVLWQVLRIFQLLQYIVLHVPFSKEGRNELKKQRRKVVLKGLLIGFILALCALILGVYVAVEAQTKQGRDLGIMIGGCTFVLSLILAPFILDYRLQRKIAPLAFQKKGKALWVKIRNEAYKNQFLTLNDFMEITTTTAQDDEILDRSKEALLP